MKHTAEITTPTPLQALRSAWWIGLFLVVIGGGAGFFFARSRPTTFTAEARLAVGSSSLQDYAVAGFPLAAQNLASNYARYVGSSQDLLALQKKVSPTTLAAITGVSASPIPESNIITIDVTATSSQAATAGAAASAAVLVDAVGGASSAGSTDQQTQQLLTQYTTLDQQAIAASHALTVARQALGRATNQAQLNAANAVVAAAQAASDQATLQASAAGTRYSNALTNPPVASGLTLLGSAAVISDDSRSTEERDAVIGGAAGLLLAILLVSLVARMRTARAERRSQTDDGPLEPTVVLPSSEVGNARRVPAEAVTETGQSRDEDSPELGLGRGPGDEAMATPAGPTSSGA